jgi:tetratricopeptide (TPR) repeat protein
MNLFPFRRRKKITDEINRLRRVVEENPRDSNSRLTLAGLYLETDDQETAAKEYQAVAEQLSAEGLDLEPIAIYRKILTLDAVVLTDTSLATAQEAENLLSRAKEAYEDAFRGGTQSDRAKMDAEPDDSTPVPIEAILDPSQDLLFSHPDTKDHQSQAESPRETDSPPSRQGPAIDISSVQVDDDLEVLAFDHRTESPTDDPLSTDDRDLHYNLGVAHYEMGLTDKAIREFVKAHNQGVKIPESLSMLAKCYRKKGLSQNAAGFLGQALKIENLTQDQIDMLRRQLEEIQAKMDL